MKYILIILLLANVSAFSQDVDSIRHILVKEINDIRSNPHAYFDSKGRDLTGYIAKEGFVIDEELNVECQEYAEAMLENDMLRHDPDSRWSESISYSLYITHIVPAFVLEEGETGHRDHLLGKNNADTKIGIGIAIGKDDHSEWLPVYYVCIRTR